MLKLFFVILFVTHSVWIPYTKAQDGNHRYVRADELRGEISRHEAITVLPFNQNFPSVAL